METRKVKPRVDGKLDRYLGVVISTELIERLDQEVDRLRSHGRSVSRSDLVRETLWKLVHREDPYSQKHPEFTVAETPTFATDEEKK